MVPDVSTVPVLRAVLHSPWMRSRWRRHSSRSCRNVEVTINEEHSEFRGADFRSRPLYVDAESMPLFAYVRKYFV